MLNCDVKFGGHLRILNLFERHRFREKDIYTQRKRMRKGGRGEGGREREHDIQSQRVFREFSLPKCPPQLGLGEAKPGAGNSSYTSVWLTATPVL